MLQKTCRQCQISFEITAEDLKFYEKVSPVFSGKKYLIPPPTLCPQCRQQRRLAFRNERKLYHRKCDLTGKAILSTYAPDKNYKVYNQKDWWSDKWDPLQYGKEFDFSKPFFQQFSELWQQVPQMNVIGENNENSDYCNLTANCRNCYLVFESSNNEDCLYGYWLQKCTNCCDVSFSHECQLCYQIDNCYNCYKLFWSQDCSNCSESYFLNDCIGCKNCFGCTNLRQKEYYIKNKPVTKEEFEHYRKLLGSYEFLQKAQQEFAQLTLDYPQKYMHGFQNENVLGDYLVNCKNAQYCFDSSYLWDCKYVFQGFAKLHDAMDIQECGEGERMYECAFSGYNAYNLFFSLHCLGEPSEMLYSTNCSYSKNLFGCIGLRHKQYCVFNKQYSKEEYEKLVPRIIEHMQKTKEFGEFFPIELSNFAYNESLAHEFFPLTQEEIKNKCWQWLETETASYKYLGSEIKIPDRIQEVEDSISAKIFTCETSGKHYKIIPQELKLYRQMEIPLPHKSFFERHRELRKKRNPRKLWSRTCANCAIEIQTTYAPDRPEIIYCEKCYLQELG